MTKTFLGGAENSRTAKVNSYHFCDRKIHRQEFPETKSFLGFFQKLGFYKKDPQQITLVIKRSEMSRKPAF